MTEPMRIVLTVADHEKNGFVSLASTAFMAEDQARNLVTRIDGLVELDAEPGDEASFAFVLDLMRPNGDCVDTGERLLPLQVAMTLAPDAVSHWLGERPEPDEVINRPPMVLALDRFQTNTSETTNEK
ncbi:Hypothetical protein NGAL_HAMBI2605_59500 [Neorhizobium galegae bv. orientalis]|nr:Hypothetical protein NGAL_HAMBI2605_59500 [Neorhizobium galegae bv. orientalis]